MYGDEDEAAAAAATTLAGKAQLEPRGGGRLPVDDDEIEPIFDEPVK